MLLGSIQEDIDCDPLDGRFSVRYSVYSDSGGIGNEGFDVLHGPLKNRFSPAVAVTAPDTELRDTGMALRFVSTAYDHSNCLGAHTSHSNGDPRHELQRHGGKGKSSPISDWIPIADLIDGNVSYSEPAEPEEPAEPTEPAEPDADALARLQAELDALRGDLSAVRDSVAFLLGEPPAGGVDTVEVVRHDTLHYCPPTDEDRRDLFDLFTGVADDSSNVEGAGKAASVKPSSWGAIKALTRRER